MLRELDPDSSRIAIVAHDAGAANLIISWVGREPADYRVKVEGPAHKIWSDKFGEPESSDSLENLLSGSTCVLTGTGWASDLEHRVRSLARARGVRSIAVIDHWVNYRERFVRDGDLVLPDEIWVTDPYALELAQLEFPTLAIRQQPNCYQEDIVAAIDAEAVRQKPVSKDRILYVLEPIREQWDSDDHRSGEFQALDYFVSRLSDLGIAPDASIRLRPHPSDPRDKYDAWIETQRLGDLSLAPDESLARSIAWSNWVAGCHSFALVLGLGAGRRVVSTIPPCAGPLRLPHADIIRLRDL